ncbi:MAG: thioredoxin-disulfide reductase [Lentisphaeria bacterium]|nr:thioredoxin-disulfide reductase [Lentisphaeria bacterium]MBR2632955.1 thioredoxin-disulfide reductase [Lentisphaeria bacterium]
MRGNRLAILGSGPAGYTAAIYAARSGVQTTVFSGRTPGGMLTWTDIVENYPGFADGIEGIELMMSMQAQAEKFGAVSEFDAVSSIEFGNNSSPHKITLSGGTELEFDAVILAMGSEPRKLGIPSEERLRGRGVSSCATCDGAFFKGVPIVVAGGGDSAMEEANYLTRFASEVHIVHRRETFRASEHLVNRAKSNSKIKIHTNFTVKDILGDSHVEGVLLESVSDQSTMTIPCRGFFCAFGHVPNTALVRGKLELDAEGYLKVAYPGTHTAIPGVFGAGDCTDPIYRQAVTAAATGCKAAMDAIRYLENA